jgi:Flp pilus assembly protein TadD
MKKFSLLMYLMLCVSPFTFAQVSALPSFVLACSTMGGPAGYRIASDGKDIYFASVRNEQNLDAAAKSLQVSVTDRHIRWKMSNGHNMTGIATNATIYRDDLLADIGVGAD